VRFSLDGNVFVSDEQGIARIPTDGTADETIFRDRIQVLDSSTAEGVLAKFTRWYGGDSSRLKAAIDVYYLVTATFIDLAGNPVDPGRITSLTLKSSHGVTQTFDGGQLGWLQGSRVVPLNQGLESKELYYTVESLIVKGQNVVNRSQQKFYPSRSRDWQIQLLFYSARFTVRDALFRFPIGSAIRLQYPDGHSERVPLGPGAEATLESLPRGDYHVSVDGPGFSFSRPVALSRDQEMRLELVSYLDVAVAFLLMASVALGLLLVRRPHLLSVPRLRTSVLSLRRRIVRPRERP
jgi:hypothetical protein